MHLLIVVVASIAIAKSALSVKSSLLYRPSTNLIKDVVKSPLCHVPTGYTAVVGHPMTSLLSFLMWVVTPWVLQKEMYSVVSKSNLSSMLLAACISESMAKTLPRKCFPTPMWKVWNKSNFQSSAKRPTGWGMTENGFSTSNGASSFNVSSHFGWREPISSNGMLIWPPLHKWQIPFGGFRTVNRFCTLLNDLLNLPLLWSQGQSPEIPINIA